MTLGLGFVQGAQGDWAAQAELARAALSTFDEFGAERPRFLAHVRILAAERELGNLRAAAHHGRVGWQGLSRLGRAEPYVLSDMGRDTALLLALAGEVEAAVVIFGWQRALIQTTGALEDEPEVEVIAGRWNSSTRRYRSTRPTPPWRRAPRATTRRSPGWRWPRSNASIEAAAPLG